MRKRFVLRGLMKSILKHRGNLCRTTSRYRNLWCQYRNQYRTGLCKSVSGYKGVEMCIGKLISSHINTARQQLNIVLTTTLTLNALLLWTVKQPNLELESAAYVYFKVIGAWRISAHPWGAEIEYAAVVCSSHNGEERAHCVTRPNNCCEGDCSDCGTNAIYLCLQLFRQHGE